MTPFYLHIKSSLESIVFGSGIFGLLLLWMLFVKNKSNFNKEKIIYRIGLFSLIFILALTYPPLYEIVSFPLSYNIPSDQVSKADAIVVLGGGIQDEGMPSQASMERVYIGSKLFKEKLSPLLLLTSGNTNSRANRSEASAMSDIARGMGVPESKIILEDKSYNTYTNAIETKKLLDKYNLKSVILVTSQIHKYRALRVFQKQEINVTSIVAKKNFTLSTFGWKRANKLQNALHEYAAILLYKFKGWM